MAAPRLPTTPERSAQMGRIKGRNTGPEVRLQQALAEVGVYGLTGFSLRLASESRALKPDIAFPEQGLVVFMDGCQWHGCPDHYVRPRSNEAFWAERLRSSVERDRRQTAGLRAAGWRVLRLWEHEVEGDLVAAVEEIVAAVGGAAVEAEDRWCVLAAWGVQGSELMEERTMVTLLEPREERRELKERSTRKWARGKRI